MNRTAQRECILKELRTERIHPTADELYDVLRHKLPQISLGTIYRNLEQMSEMGMIRKLSLTGHRKRFDGNMKRHYHMRCRFCHGIVDVPAEPFSDLERLLVQTLHQVDCDGYYLELSGACPACRAQHGETERS